MTDHSQDAWLKDLGKALGALPEAQRADILNEARAHLNDRAAAGRNVAETLSGFGTAEAYARPFVDDFTLSQALERRQTLGMIQALLGVAGRGAGTILALIGVGLCTLAAAVVIIACLASLGAPHPGHIMYLVTDHAATPGHPAQHTISFGDAAAGGHVVDLGYGIFPVAAVLLGLLWFTGRLGLILAIRSLRMTATQPTPAA